MHFFTSIAALASLASIAFAALAQGTLNLTRDSIIQYDRLAYANTGAFCGYWHSVCVSIAGPLGQHHQMDCVVSQTGPKIHAFCGGIQKNAAGGWTKDEYVYDHTAEAIAQAHVKFLQAPLTKAACLKFQERHKTVTC